MTKFLLCQKKIIRERLKIFNILFEGTEKILSRHKDLYEYKIYKYKYTDLFHIHMQNLRNVLRFHNLIHSYESYEKMGGFYPFLLTASRMNLPTEIGKYVCNFI